MLKKTIICVLLLFCGCDFSSAQLNEAIYKNDMDQVKALIKNGVNLNILSKSGLSPLHVAAIENRLNILEYLIENRADINIFSNENKTPLDYAIESGHLEIIKALNAKGAKTQHTCLYCNPLILENVVTSGDVNDVLFLKNHGADLFLKNSLEKSLLHSAAWNKNKEVVSYLIAEGLNVNEMDEKGKTPLHYAAMAGNLEIAKILIKYGADINAQVTDGEAKGMTPYDYAVNAKHKEVAEYLKSIGAKR